MNDFVSVLFPDVPLDSNYLTRTPGVPTRGPFIKVTGTDQDPLTWCVLLGPRLPANNGFDPILGPPFAAVNYRLEIVPTNPGAMLMWTIPSLLITIDATTILAHIVQVAVTNYPTPLAWSSGSTYILNERVIYSSVRYYSLADNNSNHQPDISPSFWAVDNTKFWLYCTNRADLFPLNLIDPIAAPVSPFFVIGDSENNGLGSYPSSDHPAPSWDVNNIQLGGPPYTFYVAATAGSTIIKSQLITLS